MTGRDIASRVVGAAVWLMPPSRRDWGEAMRSELACLSAPVERREFAFGCLRASFASDALVRLLKYVALVSATVAFTRESNMTGAIRFEIVLCGLLAPFVLWRLGGGAGPLGMVGTSRIARTCRRTYLVLATVTLAAAAGFLADVIRPEGTPLVVAALALLMAVLAGYIVVALALTSAESRARPATAGFATVFGVVSGIAWCFLMPFNQPLALPDGWQLATPIGVAVIAVVLPALAAAGSIRASGDAGQGWLAGLGASSAGALVVLASGTATIWFFPVVIDSGLLDTGPRWRPPDLIEQVVPNYFWLLLVAPAVGALTGWLAGLVFDLPGALEAPHAFVVPRRATAVAALAVVALGLSPYGSTTDSDTTEFGNVGTTNVVFSPAGHTVLTANADYTWILWNVDDPATPVRLATYDDQVLYSPDGLTLASRNVLWRLTGAATPSRISTFTGGEPLAFSPDGHTLLTHDRHSAMLWDVTDREHPARLSTFDAGEEASFSAAAPLLVTRDSDLNVATLRDVTDPRHPEELATIPAPAQVTQSTDGNLLALTPVDGPVELWQVANPRQPTRRQLPDTYNEKVAFSPSHLIATASNAGTVRLWNTDGMLVAKLEPPEGDLPVQIGVSSTLPSLAFSADGHILSTVFGNSLASRWDITDAAHPLLLGTVSRRTRGAGVVVFSPDRTTVAGAATDGTNSLTLWPVASPRSRG